jgi:RNA polymerase sigma-70 factor (ECF subfamily)
VFLLRDVFDFGFDEIADIVGKSEDNCRQIAVRARRHIQDRKPRFEASRERREALARRFFEALGAGTTERLVDLLAADVVLYTDGGGQGPAFPQPIYGQERVLRIFSGYRPAALGAVAQRFVEINGQPGVVFLDAQSRAVGVIALDIAGGQILAVRTITNPAKLRHLDEGSIRPRED